MGGKKGRKKKGGGGVESENPAAGMSRVTRLLGGTDVIGNSETYPLTALGVSGSP